MWLNETMRIITGCLKPTPTHLLPVLSGIASAKLRRESATRKISRQAWASDEHPLHNLAQDYQSLDLQRLKSRRPFYRHLGQHQSSECNIKEAWNEEWVQSHRTSQFQINSNTAIPLGSDLPKKLWISLNRLRSGVGRFGADMHRWGLKPTPTCTCRARAQTAEHIIYECSFLRSPNTVQDLSTINDEMKNWLQHLASTLG